MTAPRNLPVDPWPIDLEGLALPEGVSPVTVAEFVTEVLWALSGRRYGTREVLVRPCGQCPGSPATWWQTSSFGEIVPFRHPTHSAGCTCSHVNEVELPGPVADVIQVRVDGVSFNQWRVDSWKLLVRTDGQPWPRCQEPIPDDQVGTWSVRYVRGRPVPPGGLLAGREFAGEVAQMLSSGGCSLPTWAANSISQQGVSVSMDPGEFIAQGRVGLPITDNWLRVRNPGRLTRAPRILSADTRHSRVVDT